MPTRILFLLLLLYTYGRPSLAAVELSPPVKGAFFSSSHIDLQDSRGRTSLMKALRRQDETLAFLLLESGADTAVQDFNGQTVLHYALQFSEKGELLQDILESRGEGSLDLRDRRGRTALELFVSRGRQPAFLTQLGEAGVQALPSWRGENLLFSALRREEPFRSAILEQLVWIGYSLDDRNGAGRTAEQEALARGEPEIADLLKSLRTSLNEELIHSLYFSGSQMSVPALKERLNRGASPSYRNNQGFTACHYAVAAGRPDLLQILLERLPGDSAFDRDSREVMELILFFPLDYEGGTALSLMSLLLDQGLPVNIRNDQGVTLLNAGIRHSEEMAALLLQRGADPRMRDPGGVSPLMVALGTALPEEGHLLEMLVEAGAERDARDDRGGDIFSTAILYGREAPVIRRLLDLGIDADARDDFGTPGFFWAAAFSREWDLNSLLLSGDKRHGWQDKDGWTPLMGALNFYNSPEIVEALAGLYGDGRMQDGTGRDLHSFMERYRESYEDQPLPELERLIRSRRVYPALSIPYDFDADEELRRILKYGSDPEMIRGFIAEGADPALFYEDGFTPLMTAVAWNSTDMIRVLLNEGAPLFDTTPYGWSALHIASWQKQPETAALLIERGWDVNVRDFENWTPLHWAARNASDPAYLQTLLDHGADPALVSYRKDTVLHLASSAWVEAQPESLLLLLEEGAPVDARNGQGETALMLAAGMGYYESCMILLEAGADIILRDPQGEDAISRASANGHLDLAESLRSRAALRNAERAHGEN